MRSNDIPFNNINICTYSHIISPENVNREHESIHKWKDLSQWLLFLWMNFFYLLHVAIFFPISMSMNEWKWLVSFSSYHQNGNFLFHRDDFYLPFNDDCPQSFTFFSSLFFFVHDEQHKWLCWWKFYETFIISSFNNNLNSPSFIKCRKVSSSAFNVQKKLILIFIDESMIFFQFHAF